MVGAPSLFYAIHCVGQMGVAEMQKLGLSGWAAISEIFGTMAVIVSLVFVVQSINRNSAIVQAANDNLMYELADANSELVAGDSRLAEILIKFRRDEELSEVERLKYQHYLSRMLNRWELAFVRHQDGLLSTAVWNNWNSSYAMDFPYEFRREQWSDWKLYYSAEFAAHLETVLQRNSEN